MFTLLLAGGLCLALVAQIPAAADEPGSASVTIDVQNAYEEQLSQAARTADAQVRLALWCEEHGLTTERIEHLARALLKDRDHPLARALMGFTRDGDGWSKVDDVRAKIESDAKQAEALAQYNARRARTPMTARSQWSLGLWCEENGLKEEAMAHFTAVVRLDPARSAAWKRLGCKKYDGRWMRPERYEELKADFAAQRDADAHWMAELPRLRAAFRGADPARRAEAEAALSAVADRRAVPSIWAVFATGDVEDQMRAIQLFGQIVTPASSRGLAVLGVGANNSEVRRIASENLATRDPNHYMTAIIEMLRRPIRFEVRPVGGPGSPGVLLVEGEQFNREIYYAPPAPSFLFVDTGASWNTDAYGFETIRLAGANHTESHTETVASVSGTEYLKGVSGNDPRAAALGDFQKTHSSYQVMAQLFKPGYRNEHFVTTNTRGADFQVSVNRTVTNTFSTEQQIPIGRILNEYRIAAAVSEKQLENDVAQLQAMNFDILTTNDRINTFLSNVSGRNGKPLQEDWAAWWSDRLGYPYTPPPVLPRPTVTDVVPSPYVPAQFATTTTIGPQIASTSTTSTNVSLTAAGLSHFARLGLHPDCFAAGTPIQTSLGERPIETIREGDRVLSQDARTGALSFEPVLTVYHFRPSPTYRLRIGSEELVTTPVHYFWVAGKGWVMARDLEAGDKVRTRSGLGVVGALEKGEECQVFNLEIARTHSYFVGTEGCLAHDHSPIPYDGAPPFDAAPDAAQARPAGRLAAH